MFQAPPLHHQHWRVLLGSAHYWYYVLPIAYCALHITYYVFRVFPFPPSGDPTLHHFGIPDARGWKPPYDDKFDLPTPLGRILNPLYETWDQTRVNGAEKGSKTKYDIRFNLVGHELAAVIDRADLTANYLRRHPELFEVVFCRPIYDILPPFPGSIAMSRKLRWSCLSSGPRSGLHRRSREGVQAAGCDQGVDSAGAPGADEGSSGGERVMDPNKAPDCIRPFQCLSSAAFERSSEMRFTVHPPPLVFCR